MKNCPLCLGTGKVIGKDTKKYSSEVREKARKLFREGLSLRKIGKELGIEGAQKVKSLIIAKTL